MCNKAADKKINFRPYFHFTPKKGWINDPNGLIFTKDGYRLFAQHNPYDTVWGPMHWLEMESDDLILFNIKDDMAMKPDQSYDNTFGCFSGSAIEKDGRLYLIYTGATDGRQVQCLAVEEQNVFKKIEENPIIDDKDLPSEYLIKDFRDPKVVLVDGIYYCFLSTRKVSGGSSIVLFKSKDLLSWKFVNSVLESEEFQGEMFECPDIIRIDDKDLLLFSIQGYNPDVKDTVNKNNVLGCVGHMDYQNGIFNPIGKWRPVDDGFDFYATQTCYSKFEEPTLISWMNAWGSKDYTGESEGWCGRFTLPRILSIDSNNRIIQRFSNELDKYETTLLDSCDKNEIEKFGELYNVSFMDVVLKLNKNLINGKSIKLGSSDEYIILTFENNRLKVDRSNSSHQITTETKSDDFVRYGELNPNRQDVDLRVIVDVSSIEIQIDNGYSMMALNFYSNNPLCKISLDEIEKSAVQSCSIKVKK